MVQCPEFVSLTSESQAGHPAGAPRPCKPHSQVHGQFLAFWEDWGLLPVFSRCSVGVVPHVDVFLMYLWGGRWSLRFTPLPSWRSSVYIILSFNIFYFIYISIKNTNLMLLLFLKLSISLPLLPSSEVKNSIPVEEGPLDDNKPSKKQKWERRPSRWRNSKTWRSPSSPQIHQKYIYMWNNSYKTPIERWQKTSDFPKGKKLPPYLGR